MLVLSRKPDQKISIGSQIVLTIVSVKGNRVTLGIDAPRSVQIQRSELVVDDTCCLEAGDADPVCTMPIEADNLEAFVAS